MPFAHKPVGLAIRGLQAETVRMRDVKDVKTPPRNVKALTLSGICKDHQKPPLLDRPRPAL